MMWNFNIHESPNYILDLSTYKSKMIIEISNDRKCLDIVTIETVSVKLIIVQKV